MSHIEEMAKNDTNVLRVYIFNTKAKQLLPF